MVDRRPAATLRRSSSGDVKCAGHSVADLPCRIWRAMVDLSPSHELAVSLRPPTRSHRNTSGTIPMTEMTM